MGGMPIHFCRFNCGICYPILLCSYQTWTEYKIKTLLHMKMY